ncbi:MAG: O-acetyl-ADP-ribose deacetylase [Gemmatimonadaceae bacterium]
MIDVVCADITTIRVDAVVTAANSGLRGGGGVDGAIHRVAGPDLLSALVALGGRCPTGSAVMTPGFALPARFVIHAVGPIWHGGVANEDALLASAYANSFRLARAEPAIRSLAFPAISTGVYGFPKDRAAGIAVSAMRTHELMFDRIVACVFDGADAALYERLLAHAP